MSSLEQRRESPPPRRGFNWDKAIGLAMMAISLAGTITLLVWTVEAFVGRGG